MALRICRKYNSVLYSYIGWDFDELSSTPSHHTPFFAPTDHPYTLSLYLQYWGGLWVSQRVWGRGRGAELFNLQFPRKFWRTLRAKADCA